MMMMTFNRYNTKVLCLFDTTSVWINESPKVDFLHEKPVPKLCCYLCVQNEVGKVSLNPKPKPNPNQLVRLHSSLSITASSPSIY